MTSASQSSSGHRKSALRNAGSSSEKALPVKQVQTKQAEKEKKQKKKKEKKVKKSLT